MSAMIEVGPGAVRRLCCGTGWLADAEMCVAALSAIDDPIALVDGCPVPVASLWRTVLGSLSCDCSDDVVVLHPSWWPASRIGVVAAAAESLDRGPDGIVLQPRSWLLSRAAPGEAVVVEIAEQLVAVVGAEIAAVPRRTGAHPIAEEVAGVVADMTPGTATVLIDAPNTVAGARALGASIADAVRDTAGTVVQIDDARLPQLAPPARLAAAATRSTAPSLPAARVRSRARTLAGVGAAGAGLAVLGLAMPAAVGVSHPAPAPGAEAAKAATTYLVEGRVALTVPANWPTQRVVAGPGSARVQVTSPSDPEVALHLTQSPVAGETLTRAAERLRQAIDAERAGVFVDFNPSGISAGRPAVTYREVRAAHHVWWTVLLDGAVRISVGCQSRPGGFDAVRDVCDQAVRSAHAVG